MEKVKVVREVAKAIDTAVNHLSIDTIIRALYNGYEIEETPEDKVREYYKKLQSANCGMMPVPLSHIVVVDVLDMLNIKIEGVNT